MKYRNETFEKIIFKGTDNDYIQCIFKNVDFSKCDLSNIYFEECKFINCDFSNSVYSKYISKSNEYRNSKFIGTNMMGAHLENVCDMSESSFIRLEKINKIAFNDCKMIRADFRETKLNQVDFSTCDISEIMVNIEDLRGLIVTSYQAISLSTILGLKIKD